jgi:hypothetical protein
VRGDIREHGPRRSEKRHELLVGRPTNRGRAAVGKLWTRKHQKNTGARVPERAGGIARWQG